MSDHRKIDLRFGSNSHFKESAAIGSSNSHFGKLAVHPEPVEGWKGGEKASTGSAWAVFIRQP